MGPLFHCHHNITNTTTTNATVTPRRCSQSIIHRMLALNFNLKSSFFFSLSLDMYTIRLHTTLCI